MSVFLIIMFLGMFGLIMMAIPGLGRHGHSISGHAGGHGAMHVGHGSTHAALHGATHNMGGKAAALNQSSNAPDSTISGDSSSPTGLGGLLKWIPSPRSIFSFMTLIGAFGLLFEQSVHLSGPISAMLAIIPALLIERFALTPLWKSLMKFEGIPNSPLETLTLQEAEAVTPFRNGRGIVSVDRDGRCVQFRAELTSEQCASPVRVGDKLIIEEVDAENERVKVTISRF